MMMRLPKQDVVATGLVGAAGIVYLLWAVGWSVPGMSGVRATGVAILALGFAASATAVVPGFDGMLHGSKVYLTVTSMIGLVALVGGVIMLVAGSSAAMAIVVVAMGVLWLIATVHHGLLARTRLPGPSLRPWSRPQGSADRQTPHPVGLLGPLRLYRLHGCG